MVISLSLFDLAASSQAEYQYRSPLLRHITSSQPISETFARCLKYEDDHLSWIKETLPRLQTPKLRELFGKRLTLETDYTIPTAKEAAAMETMIRVEHAKEQLEKEKRELALADKNPALRAAIPIPQRQDAVLVNEQLYRADVAGTQYFACLRSSGLLK